MSEVRTTPGRCVTWQCYNPADGPECPEHAAEALPRIERGKRWVPSPEQAERARERKRAYMKRKRAENPGYCSGWSYESRKRLETTSNSG